MNLKKQNNHPNRFQKKQLPVKLLMAFLFLQPHINAQVSNIRFQIKNTQNQTIQNPTITIINKNNDSIKETFLLDAVSGNYFLPASFFSNRNPEDLIKIESQRYYAFDAPLSYIKIDTVIKKINLVKMGQAYYNSFPLNNEFGTNPMSVKIPYSSDSLFVIAGITKYALTHIDELKKTVETIGLKFYEPDLELLESGKLSGLGIRLMKKNKKTFTAFNCEELEKLRNCKELIYVAGPKIIPENIFPHNNNSYLLFTNTIFVKIKPGTEDEFMGLIKQEGLKLVNKYTPNNEPYYILESKSDVGEGINTIAKQLLQFKIITHAHPSTKNLFPKIKGHARF